MKCLTDQITDQAKRSRRDTLRIIDLPEKSETNRNLDIILQEIIEVNCPDILEQEGKNRHQKSSQNTLYTKSSKEPPPECNSQIQNLPS